MHPLNSIEKVDDDEVKLAEISKHPIGIILLYIQAAIGMTVAIGLAYFLIPLVLTDRDRAFMIGNVFAAISVVLAFIVILIATVIYRQNRLILTDRNITQILQYGLFNRKVSQLNVANVEDVTALQSGILPTLLNYGTLKIETAGEQVNFVFTFCPNAGYYAKMILNMREKMLGQMKDEDGDGDPDGHASASNGGDDSTASGSTDGGMEQAASITTSQTTERTLQQSIRALGAETIRRSDLPRELI